MKLVTPTLKDSGDPARARAPGRRLLRLVVTMAVAVIWLGSGGLREDEFQCEQAVAHLHDCCPDLEPHAITCSYSKGYCGYRVDTAFSIKESLCIQDSSCEVIRAAQICERALEREALEPILDDAGTSYTTPEQEPVCP
jgi:hypothetical protein